MKMIMNTREFVYEIGAGLLVPVLQEKCSICNGEGRIEVPNGPDDFEYEPCSCTMER